MSNSISGSAISTKRHNLLFFLMALTVMLTVYLIFSPKRVSAAPSACGDDSGNPHNYATTLLSVWGVRYGDSTQNVVTSSLPGDAIGIVFQTTDFTHLGNYRQRSPGGNLINLTTGQRMNNAGFLASTTPCLGMYGFAINTRADNFAIPEGSTGMGDWIGGKWALDCDVSRGPGSQYQRFNVLPRGTPDGYRPGGTWVFYVDLTSNGALVSSTTIAPSNGSNTQGRIVYYEPSPSVTVPTTPPTTPPPPTALPKYRLEPSVSVNSDERKIEYSVKNNDTGDSIKKDGTGVNITTEYWIGNSSNKTSNTYLDINIKNGTPWGASINNLSMSAGDLICALITVTPISGYTGGDIIDNGTASASTVYSSCSSTLPECSLIQGQPCVPPPDPCTLPNPKCDPPNYCPVPPINGLACDSSTHSSKPYLRVYGNDVVVGRQFIDPTSGACSAKNTSAKITAFTKGDVDNYIGAGSQFAVSSAGQIVSFLSANMHNAVANGDGVTKPNIDLMLNNDTGPSDFGNDSNGYTGCLPDYSKFVTDNDSTFYKPLGDLAIDDVADISYHITYNRIYVDGDLTIDDNIIDNTTSYGSLSDFKPIIVIVKGDINIKGSVTQLDGLYVALPKTNGTGGGTINTCYDPGDTPTVSACDNKLTINGSFVANKVLFNRLKGDIASATQNEASGSVNIAESFVFTSDLYFGLMSKQDPSDNNEKTTGTQYESIVGLPPVLQ